MKELIKINLNGWNVYATRFLYSPTWTWEEVADRASYEVKVAAGDESAKGYELDEPQFDMASIWDGLPQGPIDMIITGLDSEGKETCMPLHKRFYKIPGFDGIKQQPLDWSEPVRRNLAYLLAPARDEVFDYEEGLPRSCWSCSEDNVSGQRVNFSFPALHHPSFISAFTLFSEHFPDDALAVEASRQARQYGDWLLDNRLPKEWICSLFPFSSIDKGSFSGGVEGENITLFRAARIGEGMVALYHAFGEEAYLEYARHLADIFVKLQGDDGSWPYRVNPKDGAVTEAYTSCGATPARLFGLLEEIEANEEYSKSRHKAMEWVMVNPVVTKLWQGMYEDVGEQVLYQNLQHWDTNETIRYLTHYREEDGNFIPVAEELNRYIEDQFVVWGQETSIEVHCPTPTALEQYLCYFPMEVHTGNWLMSLLALHQVTGKEEYLSKGIAAANSIVQGQQDSGAFSTWGRDKRFGRSFRTKDWPGCNACAATALMRWNKYHDAIQNGEHFELGLWGI